MVKESLRKIEPVATEDIQPIQREIANQGKFQECVNIAVKQFSSHKAYRSSTQLVFPSGNFSPHFLPVFCRVLICQVAEMRDREFRNTIWEDAELIPIFVVQLCELSV